MRNQLVFAITSLLCISAQAGEWKQFTPTAYTLAPAEDKKIFALANLNGDAINVNLVDVSGSSCGATETSAPSAAGPYKINGTNVKFLQACINGSSILSPETQKGKAFFAKAITSGTATVELDFGVALHFTSEDFETVKKLMLDTKQAL